jgi:hypothetical protein
MTRKSTEAIQPLFDQIANSEVFRAAPVMRTLLIYLWEHQGKSLSEYAIAMDGLGRPPDFDPKADATVRGASRSVSRQAQGILPERERNIRVGIDETLRRTRTPVVPQPARFHHAVRFPLAAVMASSRAYNSARNYRLCAGTSWDFFASGEPRLKSTRPISAPQLPRFWKTFLGSGKRTSTVLPSPVYFRWPDNSIVIRDVSEFQNWSTSPVIRDLVKK